VKETPVKQSNNFVFFCGKRECRKLLETYLADTKASTWNILKASLLQKNRKLFFWVYRPLLVSTDKSYSAVTCRWVQYTRFQRRNFPRFMIYHNLNFSWVWGLTTDIVDWVSVGIRLGLNGPVSDKPKMVTCSRLATPRLIASLICKKRHTNRLVTIQACQWKNFRPDGPV